jgi:hypothetical protein
MRRLLLFLRSRQAGYAAVGLLLLSLMTELAERWWMSDIPERIVLVLVPALAAAIVSTAGGSPFGDLERSAAWPLTWPRLGQPATLLVAGILGFALVTGDWTTTDAGLIAARNLTGLTGAALLAARVTGSSLSGAVAVIVALGALASPWNRAILTWPTRSVNDDAALLIALTLDIAGLAVAAWSATPDRLEAASA